MGAAARAARGAAGATECNRHRRGRQRRARVAALACAATATLQLWPLAESAAATEARYLREADRLFTSGVSAYEKDDLPRARDEFGAVADLQTNQRTGAALLMLARAHAHLGVRGGAAADYRAAIEAARTLERRVPGSRYEADVQLVAGDSYYALKRYYEAATEYARILAGSGPVLVKASAAERLAGIVGNRSITSSALDRVRGQLGAERLRDALVFGQARWYGRLGWVAQGRARLETYIDSVGSAGSFYGLARELRRDGPGASFADLAASQASAADPWAVVAGSAVADPSTWRPDPGRSGVPRIGVLAPLTGQERAIGRDLLAGVRYANEELGTPFDIVPVDTGLEYVDRDEMPVPVVESEASRMVRVVVGARFLVGEAGVMAIIGPVFSTSCVAAAAVAEAAGVPLIAPLSQLSGLDTLGRNVFQMNPIAEIQGETLAEYATLVLGLRTLATLAPLTDYGHAFQRAFAATAMENGGRIVHSEWYFPGQTKDFQSQFQALRQAGFGLGPRPAATDSLALFDSLEVAVVDTTSAGDWTFAELMGPRSAPVQTPADSASLFVDTIDGVAIIVEDFADARTIAPQLRSHRLTTQLLGNDSWHDPEAIAQMPATEREYLRGCIFVSRRQGSEAEQRFIDRYRTQAHGDPGYAALGYDAARMLIGGWDGGHRSRAALREWLAGVRRFDGASGRLSFTDDRRVNTDLGLLTIDARGHVRPLGSEDLPGAVSADPDRAAHNPWEGDGDPPADASDGRSRH